MNETLHQRRYSLFLFSFILMLFADIIIQPAGVFAMQSVLILQNMLFSLLLFRKKHRFKTLIIVALILFVAITRFYQQGHPEFSGFVFLAIYLVYFLMVSSRIYIDLMYHREWGIETIAAAFSGYILLGMVFSLLFITIGPSGAFKGPEGAVPNSDYLYFSFVTLLTIGYGDITPVTPTARKMVVLLGLLGNFYSVFVIGIIIGKYINWQKFKSQESDIRQSDVNN